MLVRSFALLLALATKHVLGQTEGTVNQGNPNDPCTVCASLSEEPVTEPAFKYFSAPTDRTCPQIIADVEAGTNLLQGSATCKNLQLEAFQLGCCKVPPYEYCSVCPDGSAFERSLQIPMGAAGNIGNPSCAEAQYVPTNLNGLFQAGACSDTYLQRSAHFCGCADQEQECFLCPNEESPTNPERGEAWIANNNCEGLAWLFSLLKPDECASFRTSFGVDHAHFCKCPDYEKESKATCTMCDKGIENPGFTYTSESDTYQRTCQQAQEFAESIISESACTRVMEDVISKGCKCKDGSGPVFRADGQSSAAGLAQSLAFPMTVFVAVVHSIF